MKVILSGNEAIARGAYEAGVTVATAYPGTPSTEILENISTYEGMYAAWSPNEKVALEVLGSMFTGDMQHLQGLRKRIIEELRSEILVTPEVELVEPDSLPRSEGKAVRVIDNRKQWG